MPKIAAKGASTLRNPDISIRIAAILCVLVLGCADFGDEPPPGPKGSGGADGGPTCVGSGPSCLTCPTRPGEDPLIAMPLCGATGWYCPAGFFDGPAACEHDAATDPNVCRTRAPFGGCNETINGVCNHDPVDFVCGQGGEWACPGTTVPFTTCTCFGTDGVADTCSSTGIKDAGTDLDAAVDGADGPPG